MAGMSTPPTAEVSAVEDPDIPAKTIEETMFA
jgi:hypothetical protein